MYNLIDYFAKNTDQDMPGVMQTKFLEIMHHYISRSQGVQINEDELIRFFTNNSVNELLFYRETLLQKYGKPFRIPKAMQQRTN